MSCGHDNRAITKREKWYGIQELARLGAPHPLDEAQVSSLQFGCQKEPTHRRLVCNSPARHALIVFKPCAACGAALEVKLQALQLGGRQSSRRDQGAELLPWGMGFSELKLALIRLPPLALFFTFPSSARAQLLQALIGVAAHRAQRLADVAQIPQARKSVLGHGW